MNKGTAEGGGGAETFDGNAATYFIDRHVEEGRGEKVAFAEVDGSRRTITYGKLAEETSRFAGALYRHGVRREERIAMILRDQIEFPVVFWGALKAGAIPVPINTLLSAQVFENILADSRASILVVCEPLWKTVKPAIEENRHLRAVLVVGDTDAPEGAGSYQEFVAGAPLEAPVEACGDELAFWLYSSGSTGIPKGVRHVHSSLRATAETFGVQVLGIREDDIAFSAAKLFFAYGLGNGMTFPLSVGATTLLHAGRPTPEAMSKVLANDQPTIFYGVPTLFSAMVNAQENSGETPHHALRICTSAGEALPREVGERWQRIWGAEIVDGVGSTEMLHIFLSNKPGDIVYGTAGTPVPGYEVRLVDEHDEDVPEGHLGELLVRGPSRADGYWNRRHKSMSTFAGHWTRTGDKYGRTSDGRYVYCGRTDDMFKVSGIWVSPFEIEQTLIEHPSILEAAVVGREDTRGLVKPAAFVVLKPGSGHMDVDSLKDHVKEKIGMWKYPRWVDVVEELPKTATGKIQRFKLRGTET